MYSTNQEYRAVLRRYFHMEVENLEEKYSHLRESDFESYDELIYDTDAINRGMTSILKDTRDDPLFQSLYSLAANQFLSEDIEVGLCVLLSYDYFSDFIEVYEKHGEISESCECYLKLKHRLS